MTMMAMTMTMMTMMIRTLFFLKDNEHVVVPLLAFSQDRADQHAVRGRRERSRIRVV